MQGDLKSSVAWLYIKQRFVKSVQKINPPPRKTNRQTNKRTKQNEIGTSTRMESREVPNFFFRVDLQLQLKVQLPTRRRLYLYLNLGRGMFFKMYLFLF